MEGACGFGGLLLFPFLERCEVCFQGIDLKFQPLVEISPSLFIEDRAESPEDRINNKCLDNDRLELECLFESDLALEEAVNRDPERLLQSQFLLVSCIRLVPIMTNLSLNLAKRLRPDNLGLIQL
jgi:hypothetical protein